MGSRYQPPQLDRPLLPKPPRLLVELGVDVVVPREPVEVERPATLGGLVDGEVRVVVVVP
jgi:hypothetical protein